MGDTKTLTCSITGDEINISSDDIKLYRGTGDDETVIVLKNGNHLYVKESFDTVDSFFDMLYTVKDYENDLKKEL